MNPRLRALLPPPANPIGAPSDDEVEMTQDRNLFPLPLDFARFLQVYGAGVATSEPIVPFEVARSSAAITVWSPFHPDAREAFYNPISQLEHWAMMIRDSLDEPFPYKLAYEYGGLLPIGRVNPYDLFFRTEGLPEKWTIVILESYYHHQEFEMSFTDFLVAAFSGGENSCLRELIEPFPERFHWVPARFTAR